MSNCRTPKCACGERRTEIHLTVKDSGAGFDRKAAKESRGLGLISPEELPKLVNGSLSINSQPKRGTTITLACLSAPEALLRVSNRDHQGPLPPVNGCLQTKERGSR
jgi:signal transduction histidine kinase